MPAGRTILLGACGGIALYKVPLLISRLRELGADVQVVMTEAATKFVSPLTFQVVSGNPVHTDLFAPPERWNVEHVALAERADLAVVAPATANIIGQAAGGLAEDFLSTTLLALTCPVLFVPAMNVNMYGHPAVKRNIETLRGFGHEVMEPDTGRLASGSVGAGRYPETERILAACLRLLGPGDFRGVKVVVTAGPTREPFDPVRFVSNPSTGRMGYALAAEARERGAEGVIVSGPSENLFYKIGRKLAGREYTGAYHERGIAEVRRELGKLARVTTIARLYPPVVLFDIFAGTRTSLS